MKIIDINGELLNACFCFYIGNCEISISTIMREGNAEIAIFNKASGALLKDKLVSVQSAIAWVNNFGPRD